ncbi:hypothetical protein [Fructobacillus tropaeoli]|uniref:hypothetical protein n=1 Tax=Fructobacillus tropaeoli TaxID=709323 RepID=UPI002D92B7AB|nr:unnamed protein product [Fructobacillus tropaeoli]
MLKKFKALSTKQQWLTGGGMVLVLVLIVWGLYLLGQPTHKSSAEANEQVKKTSSSSDKKNNQKNAESKSEKSEDSTDKSNQKDDSTAQSDKKDDKSKQTFASQDNGQPAKNATGNNTNSATYQAPAASTNGGGQGSSAPAAKTYQAPASSGNGGSSYQAPSQPAASAPASQPTTPSQPATNSAKQAQPTPSTPARTFTGWVQNEKGSVIWKKSDFSSMKEAETAATQYMNNHMWDQGDMEPYSYGAY